MRAGLWFHRFNKNVFNVLNLYSVHISSLARTKIVCGKSICISVSSRVNNSSKKCQRLLTAILISLAQAKNRFKMIFMKRYILQ